MATDNSTPAIEVLTLLDEYSSLRSSADRDLRSSIWNITLARRGRSYQLGGGGTGGFGGVEYSPDDVREELRARAMLEWREGSDGDDVPDLTGEGNRGDGDAEVRGGGSPSGDGFALHFDAMEAARRRPEGSRRVGIDEFAERNDQKEGLRRRRGNTRSDDTSTSDQRTSQENGATHEKEEQLRDADPLILFGAPPPALRMAQAKSRSSVAYDVEVANLAREIMNAINECEESVVANKS